MEKKPSNFISKIMAYLPKPTSPVTFQLSPPASPGKAIARKASTGSAISMIPMELRRKPKTQSFEVQEPTSPKVSCMGRVVNKSKNTSKPQLVSSPDELKNKKKKKKHLPLTLPLSMINMFKGTNQVDKKPRVGERVPSLGEMNQYASSRGVLADFDWTACGEAIVVGGEVAVEPRKEVNLWKRRNRVPPIPLQV